MGSLSLRTEWMGQTRSSCHSAVPFSWKSMCRKSGLRSVEMAWAHVFWVALQGGESVFVKMQAGGAVFVSCCPDLVRWSGQREFMHRLVKCDFGSGLVHFRRFPPEDLVSPGRLACTCGGRRCAVTASSQDVAWGAGLRVRAAALCAWAPGLGGPGREHTRVPHPFLEGHKRHFRGTFNH